MTAPARRIPAAGGRRTPCQRDGPSGRVPTMVTGARLVRAIHDESVACLEAAVNAVPGGLGYVVRRRFYARRLAALGRGATLGERLLVRGSGNISIGDEFSSWRLCTLAACADGSIAIGSRVSLNANVYINACSGGTIIIGNDVMIGPNVVLRSSDHGFDDPSVPIRTQPHVGGSIVIEDDVWIGANVTLVRGASIGRGSVIAAGAVVTGPIEPYVVAGGVPARVIKARSRTPPGA